MVKNNSQPRKRINSVQRALDILNLFDSENRELGNTEIAKLTNLPFGTASGLVYTLKVNNYLTQNPINKKYRLGLKLADRAAVLLDQLDLRNIAAPFLEELRVWSGESINLAVRDGYSVVYIERMFGHHSLGIRSELGKRAPLHSTSLGKAILAFLPESERNPLLAQYRFQPITPFTITDKDVFIDELKKVFKLGYAVDDQENELGGRCIGAPVFDHAGYTIAAISISVPVQRFPVEKTEFYGQKLKAAAEAISKEMGFSPRTPVP